MAKFLAYKTALGTMKPLGDDGTEALRGVPLNAPFFCTVTKPRNILHHRKFFALMNLVFDNLPEDAKFDTPSLDDFVAKLKLVVGHRTRIMMPAIDEKRKLNAAASAHYIRRLIDHLSVSLPDAARRSLTNLANWLDGLASEQVEYYIPKSISFAAMDQAGFDEFYNRCLDAIAQHFLPGVSSEELRQQVEEFLK